MLSPFAELKLIAYPSNLHADGRAASAHHHHATVCADSLAVDDLRGIRLASAIGLGQKRTPKQSGESSSFAEIVVRDI
jgi:hypothetical protein